MKTKTFITGGVSVNLNECFQCGSVNIEMSDCGYSSFNIGTVMCMDCGFEKKVNCGMFPEKLLEEKWNGIYKELEDEEKRLIQEAKSIRARLDIFDRRQERNKIKEKAND